MRRATLSALVAAFLPLLSHADTLFIGMTDGRPFKGRSEGGEIRISPLFQGGTYAAFSISPDGRHCMWLEIQPDRLIWKTAAYNPASGVFDISIPDNLPPVERIGHHSPDLNAVGANKLFVDPDAVSGCIDDRGRHLALLMGNSLVVVNLPTGKVVHRHVSPGIISSPAWSHDGRRLAYFESEGLSATRSGGYRLMVLDAGTLVGSSPGSPSAPTATTFHPRPPLWTSDDMGLFYIANHSDKPWARHAYHQKRDGGTPTRIWEGNVISISEDRENGGVFLVDSKGCHRVKLSAGGSPEAVGFMDLPAPLKGARYEFSRDGAQMIVMRAAELWYGNRGTSAAFRIPGEPRGWVRWIDPTVP